MFLPKNLVSLFAILIGAVLLAQATDKTMQERTLQRGDLTATGSSVSMLNRVSSANQHSPIGVSRHTTGDSHEMARMDGAFSITEVPVNGNSKLSLGDSGVFERDLDTAAGMEHMHIMKKKPKYKKVKMEMLEPKIKYKKIKMKYKKPVKKMKKKKVKGYIKAEKMKKKKHYEHYP